MNKVRMMWRAYIWSPLIVFQFIWVFIMERQKANPIIWLQFIGVGLWATSVILGWWPMLTLKRHGGVRSHDSYVKTTKVVTSGLFSIVRHPQYLAGIYLTIAMAMIAQTLSMTLLSIVISVMLHYDIKDADTHELKKFGASYGQYMKEVPRENALVGIYRLWKKKRSVGRHNSGAGH